MSENFFSNYNQNRIKGQRSDDAMDNWLFDQTASVAPEVSVDDAWSNVSSRINSAHKINYTQFSLRIAASIALIAVALFVIRSYTDTPELIEFKSGGSELAVTFPDGSSALLNNYSEVSFPESFSEIRGVNFNGEAYFEILKSEKPFIIKMEDIDVRVLGTAFNLISTKDEVRILVDRGTVAFEKGPNQVRVEKDQEGIFNKKTLEISVDSTPKSNNASGTNGFFVYDEAVLEVVTRELAEYYNVTFNLSPSLKKCKVTATFENRSLSEVLDILETILAVNIVQNKSEIRIKGKGCQ